MRRTLLDHDADDLGNHIASAAHDHRVADAHIEARDLVGVVQGRVGHGHAADEHRLEFRRRRRRAGAADVDDDVLDRRRLFLRGEFVRDRPARRAADETEFTLRSEIVDFVDHAVDIERQRVALLADAAVIIEAAIDAIRRADQIADRQTPVAQFAQGLRMRVGQAATLDHADSVGKKCQRPPRGDARIELAQRAGRRIARIDQRLDLAFGMRARPRCISRSRRAACTPRRVLRAQPAPCRAGAAIRLRFSRCEGAAGCS